VKFWIESLGFYCVVNTGPTLKLKRPEVLRMYAETIDAFYVEGDTTVSTSQLTLSS